ncbi:pulmonary surfactant-associated protein A-like isoform X2 [Oxyura jamaicensis]|uniref:pulmonary surfactant-associated protein A-like isoform X2 n=1 Tax=Oxyura jamaicensis TaxID=8884 RepID=UPI0015A65B89|nr:pulmonary surfactant-associated protein A-like isoform X2 [Oxyura jamaicensis]
MLSQQMFHRILAVALFLLPYCARGFKSLPGKEMGDVILQLEDRISKLERVLHLEGIITASEGKIFATDGKTADFHATVKKCAEAGGSIATPRNAGENDAILYFVKHFNKYLLQMINSTGPMSDQDTFLLEQFGVCRWFASTSLPVHVCTHQLTRPQPSALRDSCCETTSATSTRKQEHRHHLVQ